MSRFQVLQTAIRETADFEDALKTRKLVERAKGILMDRRGLSEVDVSQQLQKISHDKSQTIETTAQDIIEEFKH